MTRLALILVAALGVSGCKLIPKDSTPPPPVRDDWPSGVSVAPSADFAVASISWSEFFYSPGLRTVIRTALDNNRDLGIAALRIEEARSLYRIERSDSLPKLDAGGSGLRQKSPDAVNTPGTAGIRTSRYDANVAVSAFELDLFGRLRSQNRAAIEEFLAATEARNALQTVLIAEAANAYLQWLADLDTLSVAEETLAAQERSLELISKRFEQGVGTRLDLAQIRSAVEFARVAKLFFARQVALDKNALILLMGIDDSELFPPAAGLDAVEMTEQLPVGLPSEVLLLRPDVKAAEHLLKSQNARIGAARAAFFPRISLTGSYGFASSELTKLFSGAALGAWSFAPQITMPIFQAGRNRANLDLAHIRKNIAVAEYERTLQSAFREVADELVAKETLDQELEAQRSLTEAVADAYDLSMARYEAGVDSFLTVLDAQRSLFAARQEEIDIRRQRLANLVNLYKALGGGLSGSDEFAALSDAE